MSFFAKSALALGFVSLVAADECNGVDQGGMTLPADVCLNIVDGGIEYSYEYTCDDDDMGLFSQYIGADCSGDAAMTNSTDDMGVNMTCGATDCEYALMTEYSFNDTWGSSTTMSPWSTTGAARRLAATTTTTTTSSPMWTTDMWTTDDMWTTNDWSWTTSEGIDCDDYGFPNSMEVALATGECSEVVEWGAYAAVVCQEDLGLYIGIFNSSTCADDNLLLGFPLFGDNDTCTTVTCGNYVTTSTPSDTTTDSGTTSDSDDDTTENPNDDGNSAASMDHLVALCFALIALVAGN
jgi:hypothetical protein